MKRYKSEQSIYDSLKKKYVPLWRLDTSTATVTYFDAVACTTESKIYHTNYVKYHHSFSAGHYHDRLRRLVNDGKIGEYLDDLKLKVGKAIERQVELSKQADSCY